MEPTLESQAARLFQQGLYTDSLRTYTACLGALPPAAGSGGAQQEARISLLLNRSACFLKMKQFDRVVEDCNTILSLDRQNQKAYGRKVKALCSLSKFSQAYSFAKSWLEQEPENVQAKKEVERIKIIVDALQDQGDEDEDELISGERVPPEGREEEKSVRSPNINTVPVAHTNGSSNSSNGNGTSSGTTQGLSTADQEMSGGDEGAKSFSCTYCDISFVTKMELQTHCGSDLHKKRVSSDEGKDWKFRPPPRGLTSEEYSMCPRFFGVGSCRFGTRCTQAHSHDELEEWKERFEYKKQRVQKARENDLHANSYAEQLMEKFLSTEQPETVMTSSLEGVNVHISSPLRVSMSSKNNVHSWTFTITSRQSAMRRVALLDETDRKLFTIAGVTLGPKRNQKCMVLEDQCQEWTNSDLNVSRASNEKVYRIKVICKTDIYGTFRQSVVFDFGTEPVLVQELCVDSISVTDLDKLSQDLMLSNSGRWDLANIDVIDFEPRPFQVSPEDKELLKKYPPPSPNKFLMSESLLVIEPRRENYKTRMHDLLAIEEMAMYSAIARYNVKASLQLVSRFMLTSAGATAKYAQGGELFARLTLNTDLSEDTADGRLILQNVNTVMIAPYQRKAIEIDPKKVYEGLVEEKGKSFIFLRISAKCVSDLNLKADSDFCAQVQFQLNRLPLAEMHMAIDRLPQVDSVFPSVNNVTIPWTPQRQWSEKLDGRLNAKQKECIVAITTKPEVILPPILIVGPYGTGKTFTLAQAAKQILQQENTRILICTHSNSAADLCVKEYLHPYVEDGHPEATPLRIYYRHRWVNTVNSTVLKYCLTESTQHHFGFRMPLKEDVEKHRIVVATLSTSRYLYDLGLETDYFTHILLDEAAQAMECEIIMPLGMASPRTRIVLAGDHMQLSPEVHSDFAKEHGLHISLLERLYDMYNEDSPCKILLCENYRSHKAIIDYTSELFYDNQLLASGNQPRHEVFYPLTFFTARGEEVQHQNSTAFYNNAEVYEIVERVTELQKMWPKSWGPQDESAIGVVAPYADQVVRIRCELRKRKMHNVSVERVFNVQGKQFRAIFLSTVRTRHTCRTDSSLEDLMDYGFLSNVKLLNTAITRAQSLVAVVGDPVSLTSIGKCRKLWERFLEICNKQNSLYGITWNHLRSQLDGVEMKKTYVLNPLAPEFVPNRLRHGVENIPPEPIAVGKYGHYFAPPPPTWGYRHPYMTPHHGLPGQGFYPMMPMPVPYPFNPVLGPRQHLPAFVSPKMPSSPVKTPPVVRSPIPIGAISPNNKRGGSPVVAGSGSSPGASQYTVVSVTRPGPSTPTGPISPQGKGMQVNTTPTHSPRGPISSARLQGPALPHPIPRLGYPGIPHGPLITPYGFIPPWHHSPVPGAGHPGMSPFLGHPFSQRLPGHHYPLPPSGALSQVQAHQLSTSPPGANGSSPSSPAKLQSQGAPHIQILPNVKHAPVHLLDTYKVQSITSGAQSMVQQTPQGQRKALGSNEPVGVGQDLDGKALTCNLHLQREFYSYILQKEGENAANSFMEFIQENTTWSDGERVATTTTKGAHMIPKNDLNSQINNSRQKRESVTVSVTLDEPSPRYDAGTPVSFDPSDFSDHSRRSSIHSERSADTTSPVHWSERVDKRGGFSPNFMHGAHVNSHRHAGELESSGKRWGSAGESGPHDGEELETPTVVDNMVKFIEEQMDEKSPESELGSIHIGQSSLQVPGIHQRQPVQERAAPLYLRGATGVPSPVPTTSIRPPVLSYAGALRSGGVQPQVSLQSNGILQHTLTPTLRSTSTPIRTVTSRTNSTAVPGAGLTAPITRPNEPDPLDLLRNLNIKASPGTQAFYDYFA